MDGGGRIEISALRRFTQKVCAHTSRLFVVSVVHSSRELRLSCASVDISSLPCEGDAPVRYMSASMAAAAAAARANVCM